MKERKEVMIGGIAYVFEFSDKNEVLFHVDALNSKKIVYDDDEIGFSFYDEAPRVILSSSEFVKAEKPVVLMRHVMQFIDMIVKKHKPYYFHYEANEPDKVKPYLFFAKIIADKHGYFLCQQDSDFAFHKKT